MPDAPTFSVDELKARLTAEKPAFLVDVRDAEGFESGHVVGAVNRPIGSLDAEALAEEAAKVYGDDGGPILTLCGGGTRAGKAAAQLREAGLNALAVEGGTKACRASGLACS